MTKLEFLPIMAYIGAGIGKRLEEASMDVYYDLLGDLPKDVLQTAAKRVCLEHKWATFPSVAELREAAAETIRGEKKSLSAAEAWELAWNATKKIDLEIEGSFDRACANVPPLVIEAMRSFGLAALIYGEEPVGVVRGQFMKIFEQISARDHRLTLLPQSVKASIEKIGRDHQQLPSVPLKLIQDIGKAVEDA